MSACPYPDCGTPLVGLGTFCVACDRYAGDYNAGTNDGEATPVPSRGGQMLVLPLPPSTNRMWRSVAGVKKGMTDVVLRYLKGDATWADVLKKLYVNVTLSKEGKGFKKDAASWLAVQTVELLECDLSLDVTFYFPRRGSDLDNRLKSLLDFLEGVCYRNDRQITELHAVKRYDKERPRAVVVVRPDEGRTELDPGSEFNYALNF